MPANLDLGLGGIDPEAVEPRYTIKHRSRATQKNPQLCTDSWLDKYSFGSWSEPESNSTIKHEGLPSTVAKKGSN